MIIFVHCTEQLNFHMSPIVCSLNFISKFDEYFYALIDLIARFDSSVVCSG